MLNQWTKRFAYAGLTLTGLTAAGFSVPEAWEYSQVAAQKAGDTLKDSLPLSFEIDRLKLLTKKLDEQMSDHRREQAAAAVTLDRAEQDLADAKAVHDRRLEKMRQLRQAIGNTSNCEIRIGCTKVSRDEVANALARMLEAYREEEATLKAREDGVSKQREAYRALAGKLADAKHSRDMLAQKVETLRSQYSAQQLSTTQQLGPFDQQTLLRAQRLASEIERRLAVDRKRTELEADTLDRFESKANVDVTAELDKLLGEREASE